MPTEERLFLLGVTDARSSSNNRHRRTYGRPSAHLSANQTTVVPNIDRLVPLVIKIETMAFQEDSGVKLNLIILFIVHIILR